MREKGLPKFSFHFVNLEETLKRGSFNEQQKSLSSFRYSC